MRALTVVPQKRGSISLADIPEPRESDGSVLVQTLAYGLCGTDAEIMSGDYGSAPAGDSYLVLGHENLGRVLEAPADSGFKEGDLVVGIVRRPDPVPCAACAQGEWDMCRNGLYTEHGIAGAHGFARERWRAEPGAVMHVDSSLGATGVLLEPTTIVAKAWEQVDRISRRAFTENKVAVVTGAGPVGLLAALLGVQRGLEVHVFDRVTEGLKPELVRQLGATYHSQSLPDSGVLADVLIECTGVSSVIVDAMTHSATDSTLCLTGVSSIGTEIPLDIGSVNRNAVLRNDVIFGSVNANRRHYDAGAEALKDADLTWLERLITRRVSVDDYADGFARQPDDVKVVIDWTI